MRRCALFVTILTRACSMLMVPSLSSRSCPLTCGVGYMLALPSVFNPTKPLIPGGTTGVVSWASAAGFFQGCADPVLFELSAEVTYGKAAGAS